MTTIGVIFLIVMCAVTAIGIEISARLQWFLLGFEYLMLLIFSVVALIKVYASHPAGSIHPSLSWFVPNMNLGALSGGVLLALFIYWGWDTAVSVNEETRGQVPHPRGGGHPQHLRPRVHLPDHDHRGTGVPRSRLSLEQLG